MTDSEAYNMVTTIPFLNIEDRPVFKKIIFIIIYYTIIVYICGLQCDISVHEYNDQVGVINNLCY